jgi:hypothetical protein
MEKSLHLNKEWLMQKYVDEGLSTYQIAEIVNRNPKSIYTKLKDFGIPTRSRAETIQQNAWWNIGKEHWNKGKKRPQKTKEAISKSRTGKKYPNLAGKNNGMYGRTGKENPNWKGGVTPERQKLYVSEKWKEIIKTIFRRDNYRCAVCGGTSRNLHAHHIKTWADYPENRLDIDNLITVCKKCHHWIHSKKNKNKDFLYE